MKTKTSIVLYRSEFTFPIEAHLEFTRSQENTSCTSADIVRETLYHFGNAIQEITLDTQTGEVTIMCIEDPVNTKQESFMDWQAWLDEENMDGR